MNKCDYYLVAGPTGVGKSSVISCLKSQIKCKTYSDPYENNPFIADTYIKNRYCFQSQVFFYKEFFKIHQTINNEINNNIIIQERSIFESVNIFCRNMFIDGLLNRDEFILLSDLLSCIEPFIVHPKKIIYLEASSEIILSRIRNRGRGFERNISEDFVKKQLDLYDDWLLSIQKQWSCDIININVNTLTPQAISRIILGDI